MGFVATRWTFADYDAIWSHSLRYALAGLISIPFLIWGKPIKSIKNAFLCAFFLGLGLQLQTIGIALTSLAKSGFLTVFYAIFTPILAKLISPRTYRKSFWFLLVMAFVGVALLCELKVEGLNEGDAYILASAFVFSIHILLIDHVAKEENPLAFNFGQCFFMGLMAVPTAIYFKGVPSLEPLFHIQALFTISSLTGLLFLAIMSSIIAFSVQIYAQKGISVHIVGLVFLSEAVWSALFGRTFFNEEISLMGLWGCLIILISVGLIPFVTNYEKV